MYDKYLSANNFSVNTKLPKHKGILIVGSGTVGFHLLNSSGGTFGVTLGFSGGTEIVPIQVNSVTNLNGLTGLYLN
jgi:hypothetical protein